MPDRPQTMGDAEPRGARAGLPEAPAGLFFIEDEGGLALSDGRMELRGDFSRELRRLRPQALPRELLVRAARVRPAREGSDAAGAGRYAGAGPDAGRPWAVDATAGMGEDSLLLAATGFSVTLYERDEVVAALLADALARAARDERLAPVARRMRLIPGDSAAALRALAREGRHPDVVLLDPMFPERRKSAAVKKKAQLLQRLERPCGDAEARSLLDAALAARPRKVVIKRPAKGPCLAGVRPSYAIGGKSVRYDVIVPAQMVGDPRT